MIRKKPVTGLDPVMDTGFAKRSCSGEKTRPGRYRMQSERRGYRKSVAFDQSGLSRSSGVG